MFFGAKRKKAVAAAVGALRPIVATIQHHCGLPSGFWADPYILSFFCFLIGHHARLAAGGKMKPETTGLVLSESLSALSLMDGAELSRRFRQQIGSAGAERGADDAAAIAFYTIQVLKDEAKHPLVEAAKKISNQTATRKDILSAMVRISVVQEAQRLAPK